MDELQAIQAMQKEQEEYPMADQSGEIYTGALQPLGTVGKINPPPPIEQATIVAVVKGTMLMGAWVCYNADSIARRVTAAAKSQPTGTVVLAKPFQKVSVEVPKPVITYTDLKGQEQA